MGVAMAGTLVAGLSTLPNAAWEVIFAVMTAWFAWYLWRETRGQGAGALVSGHHAPHLVHSAAMLYMFAALAGPASGGGAGTAGMAAGSSGGMQTLRAPTLGLVFALLLIAYSVRDVDRKACADGYFHVVGRRFTPAGPALATAAAGVTGQGGPAGLAGGGDSAVATVVQPEARRGIVRRSVDRPGQRQPPGAAAALSGRRQGLPGGDGRHHGLHADHHDLARRRLCACSSRSAVSSTGLAVLRHVPGPIPRLCGERLVAGHTLLQLSCSFP